MKPESRLPQGWVEAKFVDLVSGKADSIKRGPFGSAIKKSFFVPSGYKVYEQKNAIQNDAYLGSYYVNEEKYRELQRFKVVPGDYLVSCSGTIGRIVQLPDSCESGIINQALLKITLDHVLIDRKFFLYLFRSSPFQARVLKDTRGSGMQSLASVEDIKSLDILIPPLNEQRRIVAKIEALFSALDKGIESLKTAQAQLKIYRQAILKHAFEGKLTADWRARNRGKLKEASETKKCILERRQAEWEAAQFAEFEVKGKIPKNDKWKSRYKEPAAINDVSLPKLPPDWCWVSLDEIVAGKPRSIQSGPFGSNLKHSEFTADGILVIGIDNVLGGQFSMGNQNRIPIEKYNQLKNIQRDQEICL